MGFTWDGEADLYICQYDLSTFKDALAIKIMMARVLYDIFHSGHPYGTPKVELHREVRDRD